MPSPYLNQYLNIINSNLRNKFQWNLKRNPYIFIQENAFENIVCEMAANFFRLQYVKPKCAGTDLSRLNWVNIMTGWCPGSLRRQDISSHDIDYVEYVGPGLTQIQIQPPVPGGWGYHDRVNLTINLPIHGKLQYMIQNTTIYIYTHTRTQKRRYLYEYYLVCNGSISAAGGAAQQKVWINNPLLTRYD